MYDGITHPARSDIPTRLPSSGGSPGGSGRWRAGTQAGWRWPGCSARASWAAAGRCRSRSCERCNTHGPRCAGSPPHAWHRPGSTCPGEPSTAEGLTVCRGTKVTSKNNYSVLYRRNMTPPCVNKVTFTGLYWSNVQQRRATRPWWPTPRSTGSRRSADWPAKATRLPRHWLRPPRAPEVRRCPALAL